MIDEKTVRHVAKLAALNLGQEEEKMLVPQLQRIIGHIEKLSALDTTGVEPLSHVEEGSNVLRGDASSRDAGMAGRIVDNAPDKLSPFIKVPKVIE